MMHERQVGDQTIRYDKDATASIYSTLCAGHVVQSCACAECRNFSASVELAFPEPFRSLLAELGIDWRKYGEVYHAGPVRDGYHEYGGWFYLVGELVVAGEDMTYFLDSGRDLGAFFSKSGPRAQAFDGKPTITIEFTTHVPWVLGEQH